MPFLMPNQSVKALKAIVKALIMIMTEIIPGAQSKSFYQFPLNSLSSPLPENNLQGLVVQAFYRLDVLPAGMRPQSRHRLQGVSMSRLCLLCSCSCSHLWLMLRHLGLKD